MLEKMSYETIEKIIYLTIGVGIFAIFSSIASFIANIIIIFNLPKIKRNTETEYKKEEN